MSDIEAVVDALGNLCERTAELVALAGDRRYTTRTPLPLYTRICRLGADLLDLRWAIDRLAAAGAA